VCSWCAFPPLCPGAVRRWLKTEGLGEWGGVFEAHAVNGGSLLGLSTQDLIEIGVTSFPARKAIEAAVERLQQLQQ